MVLQVCQALGVTLNRGSRRAKGYGSIFLMLFGQRLNRIYNRPLSAPLRGRTGKDFSRAICPDRLLPRLEGEGF